MIQEGKLKLHSPKHLKHAFRSAATTMGTCLVFLFTLPAGAGIMVGNGGDAVLQEFNLRGIQLAAYFKAEPQVAQTYGIDPAKFLQTVKKVILEGEDHLYLNGTEVDAINYPSEMRIQVSRTRWRDSATRDDAYFVQRRIALHEYLWIYGINDENYKVSNPIISELEKSSAGVLDPDIRRAIVQNLCERIENANYAGAQSLLVWGLDLNESCTSAKFDETASPLTIIIDSFYFAPLPRSDRLELLRKMLEYGADPNEIYEDFAEAGGVLLDATFRNLEAARILVEFGGDPNTVDPDGWSVFARVVERSSDVNQFWFLLNSGGDVNFSQTYWQWQSNSSPARVIVEGQENAPLVEALLQSKKVDWCNDVDPMGPLPTRAIDVVRPEYQLIFEKHHISCGRFLGVEGVGPSCSAAQERARHICLVEKGFAKATFDPRPTADGCYEFANEVSAYMHCTDN